MPTRISLTEAPPRSPKSPRRNVTRGSPIFGAPREPLDEEALNPTPAPSPVRSRRNHSSFRSSILRDFTASERDEEEAVAATRLSTDDLRASPRILGYLLCMMAGAVMLVSVLQFYREREIDLANIDSSKFFVSSGGLVYRWKLWWTIYVAATGTGLSLLIVLVHFDTVLFPKLWKGIFQDGSMAERNLIFFLIVFWSIAVYICTSPLSVGESQANTFFTAWIGKMLSQ